MHYVLSQLHCMPFTLLLIGHLSHAWFHLIKWSSNGSWLQGAKGEKVDCGDFTCVSNQLSQSAWLPRTIWHKVIYDQFPNLTHMQYTVRIFSTHQNNTKAKYLHTPHMRILFSHILSMASPYIQPLGSPGPHWAEKVIKQDAKPSLSDSRDTDLLFLISDGGFYLPDKCQKYHSPSTIILAPQPTSAAPSLPLLPLHWIVNAGAPSETSAIPQLSVKQWYRREHTACLNAGWKYNGKVAGTWDRNVIMIIIKLKEFI